MEQALINIVIELKKLNENFKRFIQLAEGVDDETFEELHKGGL